MRPSSVRMSYMYVTITAAHDKHVWILSIGLAYETAHMTDKYVHIERITVLKTCNAAGFTVCMHVLMHRVALHLLRSLHTHCTVV